MASSTIVNVNGNFSDAAMPLLPRDGLINPGSKFLFDFADSYCNNGNIAGALPNGAVFKNLVDGAPNAINGGTTTTLAAAGGLVFAGTSNGATFLNLGLTYDLSALNAEFLVIGWAKVAANVGNNRGLIGLGTSVSAYQYSLESNSGGTTLGNAPNTGAVMQVAYTRSPAGVSKVFAIGAPVSINGSAATTLADYSASPTRVGVSPSSIAMIGTIYRVYLENLTISGASAAEQVLYDWVANAGRFT
ncbi:hypothetical protein [Polaromonas naphthalenivorans]|uniref:Uncharacterized protein n=1 Tax=Polaromonas naphthalenivorans (strain CJ2) TaxID=365044 RepID=A1VSH5_POLNA|nr:hypothetical protein [Polaromonas naphthalenivorans]ABM38603.1 hypothetical protein Pnap_3305 [Polaromonas naphthalenivorans CJ2]